MPSTNIIGAAGEHLVISRLLMMGYVAAAAPAGTPKADILVNHLDRNQASLVQVKSRSGKGADLSWTMQSKHEDIVDDNLYYCFVDFGQLHPDVYVIPAAKVAEVIKEAHCVWMRTPGKSGQAHNDTSMRRLAAHYNMDVMSAPDGWIEPYRECWKLLGAPTNPLEEI
jgi:hypothetical protein